MKPWRFIVIFLFNGFIDWVIRKPFGVNFYIWYELGAQIHFLHVDIQLSQHLLLTRLFFLHWMDLAPLSKFNWAHLCGFISRLSVLFHRSICLFLCQYHSLHYCSFVINFEIGKCESSNFALLFSTLIWLFGIPCTSIRMWWAVFPFLQKRHLKFARDFVHSRLFWG